MRIFKQILLSILLIMAGGCSQHEIKPIEDAHTRSIPLDLTNVGTVHNLMLDCADNFCVNNPTVKCGNFQKNPLLQSMHQALLNDITIQGASILGCSRDAFEELLSQYCFIYDGHDYNPLLIPDSSNGVVDLSSYSWIDPFLSQLDLNETEKFLIKRISVLYISQDGTPKENVQIKEELQDLLDYWVGIYGEDAILNPSIDNIISGTCLFLSIASYDWWENYLTRQKSDRTKIAPYLAFLLGKDAKGVVLGCIASYITGERDCATILLHGVVSGGLSSICARL